MHGNMHINISYYGIFTPKSVYFKGQQSKVNIEISLKAGAPLLGDYGRISKSNRVRSGNVSLAHAMRIIKHAKRVEQCSVIYRP